MRPILSSSKIGDIITSSSWRAAYTSSNTTSPLAWQSGWCSRSGTIQSGSPDCRTRSSRRRRPADRCSTLARWGRRACRAPPEAREASSWPTCPWLADPNFSFRIWSSLFSSYRRRRRCQRWHWCLRSSHPFCLLAFLPPNRSVLLNVNLRLQTFSCPSFWRPKVKFNQQMFKATIPKSWTVLKNVMFICWKNGPAFR